MTSKSYAVVRQHLVQADRGQDDLEHGCRPDRGAGT